MVFQGLIKNTEGVSRPD